MWNRKVFIRIIEVLLCIACVITLRVTDDESRRVFTYLRYRSREWRLLNNVTWGVIGGAFATATTGGYLIITAGLLLAAATGELRGRKTETFFLILGVIFFLIIAGLCLFSLENVPEELIDNGIILGTLCFATAIVFIIDLLMSSHHKKKPEDRTFIIDAKGTKPVTTLMIEKEKVASVQTEPEKREEPAVTTTITKNEEISNRDDGKFHESFQKNPQERHFDNAERQIREYEQNVQNVRSYNGDLRRYQIEHSPGYRDNKEDVIYYRKPDFYQRPVDEIDTPAFPSELNSRRPIFAKMSQPGVKIMRVDREIEDNLEGYRYSDSSQYDNVPSRMRVSLHKKKPYLDASPPPKYVSEKTQDEIQTLEEYFHNFRTTTGTQTSNSPPISGPNLGYVRKIASNWGLDQKPKTRK